MFRTFSAFLSFSLTMPHFKKRYKKRMPSGQNKTLLVVNTFQFCDWLCPSGVLNYNTMYVSFWTKSSSKIIKVNIYIILYPCWIFFSYKDKYLRKQALKLSNDDNIRQIRGWWIESILIGLLLKHIKNVLKLSGLRAPSLRNCFAL